MFVLIGVCTYRGPLMLKACLDSLSKQNIPKELSASVVVVDNELERNAWLTVNCFAGSSCFPVEYVHEPRRGIAAARNAILREAARLDADYIAMIDDDETADPNWIAQLMAPKLRDTPIVSGHRVFVYDEGPSFWEKPRKEKIPPGGTASATSTANVRFSRALIDAGLSFDEALNLTGGEDNDFFNRAHTLGFTIGHAPEAVTYEVTHTERMTYRGLISRHATYVLQDMLRRNDRRGEIARLPHSLLDLLTGTVVLLVSPISILFGMRVFRSAALRGGKHVARGMTRIIFLTGRAPQYYRETVGR